MYVASLLPSAMSYEMNIYFGKISNREKDGGDGANIPQVGGWGHVVPEWEKEREVLGITYFGSIDKALCLI